MIARTGAGGNESPLRHKASQGRSDTEPQLKSVAQQTLSDLENYAVALQAHWGAIARRFFFKIALWGFAFLAALVFVVSGLIFLLIGIAETLSAAFGQMEGFGKLIVGLALVGPMGVYLAYRSTKRHGRQAANAKDARSDLKQSAQELARRAATPAGLCAAAVVGAGATRLVSSRALRRLTLFALRTARSIGIASLFAEKSKADAEMNSSSKRSAQTRHTK